MRKWLQRGGLALNLSGNKILILFAGLLQEEC